MASDVDIVNIGLITIGESKLTSLSGTQKRQTVAAGLYEPARQALLTEIDWRFATHTQVLARQATTPTDTRYKYQYSLPTNPRWLKTQRVTPGGTFEHQGNVLLSNNSSLTMTYTADVDEDIMPPYFSMLLGLRMGVLMAIPLTKSSSRRDDAEREYEKYLPQAKFADSSQQPNKPAEDAPFIDVRA